MKLTVDRLDILARWEDYPGWSMDPNDHIKWRAKAVADCVKAGWLEHDRGLYRITDAGRAALAEADGR